MHSAIWILLHSSFVLATLGGAQVQAATPKPRSKSWSDSEMWVVAGHYPATYCTLSHVVLDGKDGVFRYQSQTSLHERCIQTQDVWSLSNETSLHHVTCHVTHDEGHVFTVYYHSGNSNYFHLHIDMMMPLYAALWQSADIPEARRVLLPSVESRRLERADLDTSAFEDPSRYWMQMIQTIAGNLTILPLATEALAKKNSCFRKIHFGTTRASYTDQKTVQGFVKLVTNQLGVKQREYPTDIKIGIIQRRGRRRILNQEELVTSLQDIAHTETVEFSGMTFKQQVEAVQQFTVLVGMNGAGLTNALYLPTGSVAVQLVPYKAQLNYGPFGAMLRARGGLYMEWHNKHENLTSEIPNDTYRVQPDTIVHLAEFREVMLDALHLAAEYRTKDEL